MKTQKNTNPTLPSPVKFSLYIIAVAVVCFLNWNALKASDFPKVETQTLRARLDAALVPVVEEELILEDWMLTISEDVAVETEIVLEDWMLTFNTQQSAVNDGTELALEDWMLIVPDPAPALEDWMVDFETWVKVEFLATK